MSSTEVAFGSNPYASDTDNDDIADDQEWLNGDDPGITVFILGVSPIVRSAERSGFRNYRVDSFNQAIEQMCESHGIIYVDMSALKKGGSGLPSGYSSDKFVHLSRSGLAVYTQILREAAKQGMEQPS